MTAIGPLVTIAVPIEISGKAPSAHLETLTHPGAGSPLPGWYGTLARPAASASGQSLWRCINGIGVCLRREAGLPQRGVGALDHVGGKLIGGAIGVIVDLLLACGRDDRPQSQSSTGSGFGAAGPPVSVFGVGCCCSSSRRSSSRRALIAANSSIAGFMTSRIWPWQCYTP